jgi:hypothetical protein
MTTPPWISSVLAEAEHLALDNAADRQRLVDLETSALASPQVRRAIARIVADGYHVVLSARSIKDAGGDISRAAAISTAGDICQWLSGGR